jgi:hypothetical protein
MLQAAVAALAPQLNDIPLEHWPQAIQTLAQVDPARAQLVSDTLQNWGAIQQAQQQEQQRQALVQNQQFEATVASEDTRLTEMFGGDKAQADAANAALVSFLGRSGVPRGEMVSVIRANPALQTAEARLAAWKAEEYDRIKSAPKAVPEALPAVQRPGVQRDGPRPGDNSSKIQNLQKQLAGANGDKAARIAGQIRSLRRSG